MVERGPNRHDERIAASCLTFDEPIDWTAFCVWRTMLLHGRGEDVLRVKGIVNVPGLAGSVIINGVQHIIHRRPTWSAGRTRTGIRASCSSRAT